MPKKIVRTTFACKICDHEYDKRENALECEERGIALPEFKEFEVVGFVNLPNEIMARTVSGFQVRVQNGTRAVIHNDANEDTPNQHFLPLAFDVWLYTPGQKIGDRDVFKEIAARVERRLLRKIHINSDDRCPLCACGIIRTGQELAYDYLGGHDFPFIRKVERQECIRCGVRFFTTAQSRNIDTLIRQKCRWPVANTKKLIKEGQFDW